MDDEQVPVGDEPPLTGREHDRARLRRPLRALGSGVVVSFVAAFGTSALGASGAVGLVTLLLLLAVTFGLVGVWVGAALLRDEFRGERTSWRRGGVVGGLFLAALLCMTAVGGIAGSAVGA